MNLPGRHFLLVAFLFKILPPVSSWAPILFLSQGVEFPDGQITMLTKRGAMLPVKSEWFTTSVDNQTSVLVNVYEGESPSTKWNRFIGSIILNGITPSPRGVPVIDVKFENYILSGDDRCRDGSGFTCIWRLRVTVKERSTGKNEAAEFDLTTCYGGAIRNCWKGREEWAERHISMEQWEVVERNTVASQHGEEGRSLPPPQLMLLTAL